MSHIIGIDLGTTSSRVSVMKDGAPVIIENAEGDGTTPSHVAITDTGLRLVGKPARRYALKEPGNAVFAIKRLIGRSFDDPIIQKLKKFMPYEIVKADNGGAWVRLHGKNYSPEEIAAFTLQKMKASAEAYLGHSITEAVITVPAYFNDSQRQSTKDAGEIAGLNVKRIISEPTAAALSYKYGISKNDEKIAVYDLGGGTFDISIIETAYIEGETQFEVLSTSGDTFLGGEDFDIKLVEYIASEFQKSNPINLLDNPIAMQRLKEAAEVAKIILSTELLTEIDLPFITTDNTGIKHLNITITRELFENLICDLVKRSIDISKQALKDAKLNMEDVDRLILVGGSTRIPLVQQSLQNFFGTKLYGGARREDYVALGAAVQAGVLNGEIKDVLLLDVIPLSLGIETIGGVATKIIKRNTTIPNNASQVFSTAEDNQEAVTIHIVQGEEEIASKNISLGRFDLTGIPPAPRGSPQIEVAFDIDGNSILNVSAKDKGTGKKQNIVVRARGGLSNEEIKELTEVAQNPIVQNKNRNTIDSPANNLNQTSSTLSNIVDKTNSENISSSPKIFISYAREDLNWAKRIQKSLSIVASKEGYDIWIDRMIDTGDYWEARIYSEIEKSSIAILILSSSFLTSGFILKNELPRILAEKERRYMQVFPIIVRSCPVNLNEDLAKFQFFNDPKKPFASLQEWEVDEELTRLTYKLAENKKD